MSCVLVVPPRVFFILLDIVFLYFYVFLRFNEGVRKEVAGEQSKLSINSSILYCLL